MSKPVRQLGQNLRDVPTYTIPEAAAFLAVPERTMRNWFSGANPTLNPSLRQGHLALLSFSDICEAYVLEMLRKVYGFRLPVVKRIVEQAQHETRMKRPLIEADLRVVFSNLVMERPARGKSPRRSIDLAHSGHLVFPEFVDMVGHRVVRTGQNFPHRLYPWKLISMSDDSRPVTVDPEVMSGRLVISGTRIPVSLVKNLNLAGQTSEQIASSYHIDPQIVRKALLHIDNPVQKVA